MERRDHGRRPGADDLETADDHGSHLDRRERGESHLAAISNGKTLEAQVTDVLLERGDKEVVQTPAANAGARFSEGGYATLVNKAESDENLSETVGSRQTCR